MSYNPQNPNGQATAANSTPVVVASDQSAIAHNLTEVDGNVVATAASGIPKVGVTDASGNPITSTSSALDVNIKSGGTASAAITDETAWTAGTTSFTPVGGVYNDSAAALTSGQEGTARLTNNRAVHTNLRSSAGTELATLSAPLRIDPVGTTTQPVSGTVSVNALPAGTNTIGNVELVDSGGTNKASISAAGAVKVDGSAVTQPVSGTITANVGTTNGLALDTSVNGLLVTQGSTTSGEKGPLAQGAVTTGAPTYTTAQTNPLSLDTSGNLRTSVNNTVTVSGTVTTTPPANASTNIAQVGGSGIALGQATMASSLPVTIASNQTAFSDNVTQFGGSAVVTGTGASGSGIPRVTVSNDSNVLATQSGTWTVQPGNTANTTPWLVSLSPSTTGGWSVSSQTALTNTVVAVKASVGQLGGYMFYNPNALAIYIQMFNVVSGSVTIGTTTPTYVIALPPNGAANIEFANGIAHSTAISAAATTTATGAAAPTTALTGFFLYK
jgi:hypothetical protein